MSQDNRTKFIVIVVVTAICAFIVAPIPNKPSLLGLGEAKLNLGIDLAGGAEIRYRVLYDPGVPDKAQLTAAATEVIRKRIEGKHAVKEPKIIAQGDDQIVVQMAGVDADTLKEYKRLIETTGTLELYEVAPVEYQEKYNREKAAPAGFKTIPNSEVARGVYGADILVREKWIIDGKNIIASEAQQALGIGGATWETTFALDTDGAKFFDEAAARLFSYKPEPGMIAIVLDGKLKSFPRVNSGSFGGRGVITGAKNEQEAKELAIVLKSGALPAPIGKFGDDGRTKIQGQPEAETFVGPTLGQDSIQRGLTASLLTLLAVAAFMVIYYRTAGFIAVITVALNLVYLMAIMSFFKATLTLPGIAGIVLTVGMAVDANILILERIREEMARGKTANQAFDAGYDRAWWTIVDSNITTLVAGMVLYYFGTGPVQGFAVTLSVGILTTLLSVLFCSKVFIKMLLQGGLKEFKMMSFLKDPKVDFIKAARTCVIASAIGIAGCIAIFVARGKDNFGIDFKGGTVVIFATHKPMSIQEVRDRIATQRNEKGAAKYDDASVQTVAEPEATRAAGGLQGGTARTFQMRTGHQNKLEVKADLQELFKNELSHDPFDEMTTEETNKNPRVFDSGPAGPGWTLYVKAEKVASLEALTKKLKESPDVQKMLTKDSKGAPELLLEDAPGAPEGLKKFRLNLAKADSEREGLRGRLQDALKVVLLAELAQSPFLAEDNIGSAVAKELGHSTIWAMIVAWILMIVYVALRFSSWRYGVAAVLALVHDAIFAIGFTSLAGAIVPKSWGLSFDMSLNTLAAVLTVIGFSINDTIVVFDRIRENLALMKKATFAEIINASVNQTLSRTIITAFTVWISVVVLYLFTATTGGGIAEFSFPLIMGVIAGTYSTVYIAAPIVLWWYKGQKPASS